MKTWEGALDELRLQMTQATFNTWLQGSLLLSTDGGRATIAVRHTYAVDWLQNRLSPIIKRTLDRRLAQPVEELVFMTFSQMEGGEEP